MKPCWLGAFGLLLAAPALAAAVCGETPAVQMDERTAASHLLAKKDLVLPKQMPEDFRIEKVVLIITVDREGTICQVKPTSGPKHLRKAAVRTVKEHWRYRRFLVNWKPVVAQFPVTVKFLLPKEPPRDTARVAVWRRPVDVVHTA